MEQNTIDDACLHSNTIHQILNNLNALPRYDISTLDQIPFLNGVYIVFEKGEMYGEMDRIVYVGCNHAADKLIEGIKRQFSGSKNTATLRKHIGAALLAKKRDSYYRIWQKDSSSSLGLKKIGTFYDENKELETEADVSAYINDHMSVSCIPVVKANLRTSLETHLISVLQKFYTKDTVSDTWLGKYSPQLQIQETGIWHTNAITGEDFTLEESHYLQNITDPTVYNDSLRSIGESSGNSPFLGKFSTNKPSKCPSSMQKKSNSFNFLPVEKDIFYKEADVVDGVLIKRVDDNLLKVHSFILPPVCISYFVEKALVAGERKQLIINYGGEEYNASLSKDGTRRGRNSCSVSINWDKTLSKRIKESIRDTSNYPILKFIKSYADEDSYKLRIQEI